MAKNKKIIKNYLYMTKEDITINDIYEALDECKMKMDLWEAAGIIEIECADKRCIDIEHNADGFSGEDDIKFVSDNGVHSIFNISLEMEDDNMFQKKFSVVIEKFSGALCSDSDDFRPYILGGFDD